MPYCFKKNGTYYSELGVPQELSHHCDSPKTTYSVGIRSASVATQRERRAAEQLDEYGSHLRVQSVDRPRKHRLRVALGG
ncbi:hypothetical protein NBRC116589_07720 [Ruegeria sp. HU-ET01832]